MESKSRFSEVNLRGSMNRIILGITFGMGFFTFISGAPLAGFIKALGADDLVYGIIMAMPALGNVFQIFASYLLETTGKRKLLFMVTGYFHRLILLPAALIPFVIPEAHKNTRLLSIAVLIALFSISSSITAVSFWSWMGDIIPSRIKGRFFSRRIMISTITAAIFGIAFGIFLGKNPSFEKFSILFVIAVFFGALDFCCFVRVKHPPMRINKNKATFFRLLKEPFGNRNYVKFIGFVTLWNFGINFSLPFFNTYLLEHLKADFLITAIYVQILGFIATIMFIGFLGRNIDKYGNKPIIAVCCAVLTIIPLFWCLSTPQNFYIVLAVNFFTGLCVSGTDMASLNLSVWLAPEKNRSIYIACYTAVTSLVGIVFANICGGFFMRFSAPLIENLDLPFLFGQKLNSFFLLFMIAALIRFLALIFLFPRFNEDNSSAPLSAIKDFLRFKTPKKGIAN